MNITRAHVLGFAGLVGFAGALYWAKAEAQAVREQVAALKVQVDEERRMVRTLEAELAWLERPDRLEATASQGLGLAPVRVVQMTNLSELDIVAPMPALTVSVTSPREPSQETQLEGQKP